MKHQYWHDISNCSILNQLSAAKLSNVHQNWRDLLINSRSVLHVHHATWWLWRHDELCFDWCKNRAYFLLQLFMQPEANSELGLTTSRCFWIIDWLPAKQMLPAISASTGINATKETAMQTTGKFFCSQFLLYGNFISFCFFLAVSSFFLELSLQLKLNLLLKHPDSNFDLSQT